MSQPITDLSIGFESQTCGRCNGSGHYSFNMMDGTRCYGCGGSGVVYTKRGRAARSQFDLSILVPAGDAQVGWIARGSNGKWFPIRSVETLRYTGSSRTDGVMVPYDLPGVCLTYGKVGHIMDAATKVAAQPNIEAVREKLQAAYAYQLRLTQAGTVSKKAA
jgi:hypothetical protein